MAGLFGKVSDAVNAAIGGGPTEPFHHLTRKAWDHSIGVVDRPTPESQCTCGRVQCCGGSMWFSTYAKDDAYIISRENAYTFGCCGTRIHVPKADALGKELTFDFDVTLGYMLCPCCTQGPTMYVFDGPSSSDGRSPVGRPVASAEMKIPCGCSNVIVLDGKDAAGRSRFTRRESCCKQDYRWDERNCCGWHELSWPIQGPAGRRRCSCRTATTSAASAATPSGSATAASLTR